MLEASTKLSLCLCGVDIFLMNLKKNGWSSKFVIKFVLQIQLLDASCTKE